MKLVSKNKYSVFLFSILLVVLVTSLSNPVILLLNDIFSLRVSSFILYLILLLSVLKYFSNSKMYYNTTLLKLIPLFFVTLIISTYYTFDVFSYRKLNGLISYFYLFIFISVIGFEKISYENARLFFRIALVIIIISMYVVEIVLITELVTNNTKTTLFYVFPFQFLYFSFFSKKRLLDKVYLVFSILGTVYAFSFDFQKGAFIYIFATLFFSFWITKKKIKLSRKILLLTLIGLLLLFGYDFVWKIFSNEIFEQDFSSIISSDFDTLNSTLFRFYVYQYAFESLTSDVFHFLFGYGPGHFSTIHDGATPHSSLLYLLISFGFFGSFSFYFLVFLSLRRVFKGLSDKKYLRIKEFIIVFILSGLTYSLFNNANGLSWEEYTFATNILIFIVILLPFNLYEGNNDYR